MNRDHEVLQQAAVYRKKRTKRKAWQKVVTALGAVVVFVTTYALIIPAITMETDTFCGYTEHEHDDSCYVRLDSGSEGETVLSCTTGSLGLHVHGEGCFDANGVNICGLADYVVHSHGESCYNAGGVLVCSLPERAQHVHGESCYSSGEGHTHGEECYISEQGELSCTLPEGDGHVHGESCWAPGTEPTCGTIENHVHDQYCFSYDVLVCPNEENHVHSSECCGYVLVCSLEEAEPHSHSSECYEEIKTLVCDTEESSGEGSLICNEPLAAEHIHGESCFTVSPGDELSCTLSEGESHSHTARCYGIWALECTREEHAHELMCYSDPDADVETSAMWEASFAGVQLTDNWDEDVLNIARSQMGYSESVRNYYVPEGGTNMKGYTRYGDWYAEGYDYGDWCAMFVSFCLYYAGVEDYPLQAYCPFFIDELEKIAMFERSDDFEPLPGDIIFFDWECDDISDHVGLVEYVKDGVVHTIEGNSGDSVARREYELSDVRIVGYGLLPVNPKAEEKNSGSDADATDRVSGYSLINEPGTIMHYPADHHIYQYSAHRVNDKMTLTYMLVPRADYSEDWTPSTTQWTANAGANYIVTYCADRNAEVSGEGADYVTYRVHNSAFSDYADVLAGIVNHAYPFISAEEMRTELKKAYEDGEIAMDLSCCKESDFIAAGQWAVWDATGRSGTQTQAHESSFPDYDDALNPLTDPGHTDADTIQSHVKAIRDWLMTQVAHDDIEVAGHESVITRNEDGTYEVETTVSLDRPLENGEIIEAVLHSGEAESSITVSGEGTQSFVVTLRGLSEAELLAAKVKIEVHYEHMQVYVYDSESSQDMISGQWGADNYELSFDIDVETTSVDVTKHWADGDVGAEYIEVQLYADGVALGETQRLSGENNWTYTWSELVKYSAPDVKIDYSVREVLIPGFYSAITRDESGTNVITTLDISSAFSENGIYALTANVDGVEQALVDEGGSLAWSGGVDVSEPASLQNKALWVAVDVSADGSEAYLVNRATGNYLSCYEGKICLFDSSYAKTYFLYNHLYFLDGIDNQYLSYLDGGLGYVTTDWDGALPVNLREYVRVENATADISFLISNSRTTEMTSARVEKKWTERSVGSHPDSVEVRLLQNGEPYGSNVTLSEENAWSYEWGNLPLKLGETSFSYSVEEVPIEGYSVELESLRDEDGSFVFTLTNTWTPETLPLVLHKTSAVDGAALPGAQFILYLETEESEAGAESISGSEAFGLEVQRITTGADGSVRLEEMWLGHTYWLAEIVAPSGFMPADAPVAFRIEKDEEGNALLTILSGGSWAEALAAGEDGTPGINLSNTPMYILPETGGAGTNVYTIGGLLLCTGAAILLLYNFKPRRKEDTSSF